MIMAGFHQSLASKLTFQYCFLDHKFDSSVKMINNWNAFVEGLHNFMHIGSTVENHGID